MPDYIDHLWFGAPPAVEAAIADHPNTVVTTLDGVAYVNVRSETPLETPPGLGVVGPELARVVTGYWLGDTPDLPVQVPNSDLRALFVRTVYTVPNAGEVAAIDAVNAEIKSRLAQVEPLPASDPRKKAVRELYERWEYGNFMIRLSDATGELFQGLAPLAGREDWEAYRDEMFAAATT